MAAELFRFFAGVLLFTLPGVFLARKLKLGSNRAECAIHGACLGLALAVYVGSLISHVSLHWFLPAWLMLGLIFLAACYRPRSNRLWETADESQAARWMLLVALVVGFSRYALTLTQLVPNGSDPTVFLILARKIQLAQHSVSNWLPFENAQLNYPPGAHVLVAIWATVCGLPLQTVFKNLIPLLDILMTAEVFIFTRRITKNVRAATFGALAYGMWAGEGSINFYNWGGLPNELALLFFLAMLAVWLEDISWPNRLAAMALLYSGVILVHHHTLLTSAGVILTLAACMLPRRATRPSALLLLFSATFAAILNIFFLIPYVAKVSTLPSTNAFHSEGPLNFQLTLHNIGIPFLLAAAAGIALSWRRRAPRPHPAAICICITIAAMFITCEYILPPWLAPHDRFKSTPFSPSHFLNDIVCFLAVFVGIAVAQIQQELRLPLSATVLMMLIVATSQIDAWRQIARGPDITPDYIQTCRWIAQNTSSDTILRADSLWAPYFAWRRPPAFWLPDSEQHDVAHLLSRHIELMLSGQIPPDSPQMKEVEIIPAADQDSRPILWKSPGGLLVVQDWPR